jgi:hypothetical protein
LPPTASATITAAGTYTVTVADANTCTATGSATVVPFASPTAAITGNTTFCTGSSTTLTASGGTAYTWNTTPVRYTAGVLITAGGTYTVTVTNANGCTATQSVTVTVNTNCCNLSITDIVYTINSNNRQVQFQTPVLANGSSGTLTYNWTFGDPAVPNSTNAAPFVVYPTAGLKTVCLTVRLTKTDGTICATQCCRTIAIGDTTNMLTNFSPQFAFIAPSISPTNTYQFNGQINPSTVVSTYRLYNSTTTGTQGTLLATYVGNSFSYTFPTGGGEYIVSREISAVSNANTLMGNYNTLVESRHVTVLSVNGCNATAGFTATFTSNASRTVAFANAGTASSNGYIWEFATTLTGVYSPIAGTAASQSFTFPGTTTTIWVRLTINKGLACESSMTHRVEMTTAAITSSNTNFRISTMQFTTNSTTRQLICAAPTVISTSAVTNTVWAAPAGSATATGSASAPTFTFVNPGLYTVTVTVVFANGFKSVAARTVNIPTGTPAISASAPFLHASFSYYADHTIGSSAYNFANSATTYPANYTHLWELFNGFATTGTPILTGTNSSIGYAPTVAGDFSVCHTISVADNTTFGAARRVRTCRHETGIASTNGCGAVPRYTARLSSAASTTAIFTGTSTNANTSVWEYATTATGVYSLLGSAANAALASPTFNFGGTGTYWVRLTINKGTGCEASVTHRIELNTNSCQAAALLVAQAMPNGQTQRSLLLTPITSLNEVVLYPNPTSGSFTLSFGESLREEADIQLIDMRGTQLAQTHIEAGSTDTTLDLTDFATGVYLVQIRTASGEKIVRKVVKQ